MIVEKFEQMIELQDILRQNNQTITCAESCTGGLIASKITEVSGSSSIFRGSVITYCNEIKEQELNVKKQTMIDNGVVSVEVVKEMLDGVLKKFDATYAIAVSGVAGPTGGTKAKPVGTVALGIKDINGYENVQMYHFDGNRKEVQEAACNLALKLIFDKLQNL
jgi:nicotinamide-nucleotide amidase